MSDKPNNPPAFPHHMNTATGFDVASHAGMTLRDYFAARALTGMLADPNVKLQNGATEKVADLAYEVADAMLKARES